MVRELKKRQDLIDRINAERNIENIPGWATWDAQQAEDYIENNVIDLNSAKQVLKKMAILLVYLRDK